jgi:hypothetical protein
MDTYRVAELQARGSGVLWFYCTHQRDAKDILTRLRELLPCKIETKKSGAQAYWMISSRRVGGFGICWWLMGELGARGWEPFAAFSGGRPHHDWPTYLFRKGLQQ